MLLDADLHIHSRFSIASSRSMVPSSILDGCRRKGIGAVGSGDALHGEWRRMWDEAPGEGPLLVIPSAEVEDRHRVHHLVLAETFGIFEDLTGRFSPSAPSISTMGRPHLRLSGEEIAREVHEAGGFIGPAHAFTPWTSLYASFNRMRDCYGDGRTSWSSGSRQTPPMVRGSRNSGEFPSCPTRMRTALPPRNSAGSSTGSMPRFSRRGRFSRRFETAGSG